MSGTWLSQNKVLPGVYINFLSNKPLAITPGDRGIVSIPLTLDWGSKGEIYEIGQSDDTLKMLGYSKSEIIPIREVLKNAKKVIVYKVNSGTKATGSIDGTTTITAAKEGFRGNDINVVIKENATKFDIVTYVGLTQVDSQTVATYEEFTPNGWIVIEGTGIPTVSSTRLATGTTEQPTASDYDTYLNAMKTQFYNTMAYTGVDSAVKTSIALFIRDQRENEGVKIQAVMHDASEDYEGIINVGNGVMLSDGTTLTPAECCAWVAGATAGANINESRTNFKYVGAIDVVPRMTKSQKEQAIRDGEFIFTVNSNQDVTVLYDINSLVTFTPTKAKDFRKNRVIRTLDNINNDIVTIFESNYMGKVDNNEAGRSLLKASLVQYFNELQRLRAVQNFDNKDIIIGPGTDIDAVLVECAIQPVDSAEKFYITVNVK